MISSRPAVTVHAYDVVTVPIGPVVHVGEVLSAYEAVDAPIRRVLVVQCRTCHHIDALVFAPFTLVTTERAA